MRSVKTFYISFAQQITFIYYLIKTVFNQKLNAITIKWSNDQIFKIAIFL